MNDILTKIEDKIKKQENIPTQIEKIDLILLNKRHYLSESEIKGLEAEKLKLQNELMLVNLTLEEKHKNFIYSQDDISNAPDISWLIDNVLPHRSIGVLIGRSGSGKTTVVINFCKSILAKEDEIYIVYIDGDMNTSKIREHGIGELMATYGKRFMYAGKSTEYFSEVTQNFLRDAVAEQERYQNRKYFIIEDSLTLTAKKKRGFIDTEHLYKYERKLRNAGGSSLLIHHTNKAGIFADSQQIENYADYTYLVQRNEFNSCILLHTQKASRYAIEGKAFLTEDRQIVKEVDYETANIDLREAQFVTYVLDALQDGEMNQSELISHLEKMRFFMEYKVGQKKSIGWLKKWREKGKWDCEKRASEKNAIFYWIKSDTKNCQTCQTKNKIF